MRCCNPVTHYVTTRHGYRKLVTHGCGKCEACLKKRSKDWVFRCSWEARKYPYNWIVTLTYADEFLHFTKKGNATLCKDDFQRFMKRLRKQYPTDKIRYLVRGEYGGKFGRPHMHMILFGFCCSSKEECGFRISDQWPYGGVYVDTYSDKAVQYVTNYILKSDDLSVYKDDEIVLPYINVSQRPAIGENFIESKTAKRAKQSNDYILFEENSKRYYIPRLLAKKLDKEATSCEFEEHVRRHKREDVMRKQMRIKEKENYSANYHIRSAVDRAQAIEGRKHRDYLRNKSKN